MAGRFFLRFCLLFLSRHLPPPRYRRKRKSAEINSAQIKKKRFYKKPLGRYGRKIVKGEASSRPVCRSQSAVPVIRGIVYSQIRHRADHRTPTEPSAAEFSGLVSATVPSEQGKSASTIKTDLSAIRFFQDKMSCPKYTLPGNEELGVALERRCFGQQDRTWTNPEFSKLIGRAMAEEREDYILALYLARYAGLRIHECFRMDTAAAERALRENALTVKGKGGKIRIVPIEDNRITMMLERLLEKTERGHKLLVPDGVPTDRAIKTLFTREPKKGQDKGQHFRGKEKILESTRLPRIFCWCARRDLNPHVRNAH